MHPYIIYLDAILSMPACTNSSLRDIEIEIKNWLVNARDLGGGRSDRKERRGVSDDHAPESQM